jgi:hypothetical protein
MLLMGFAVAMLILAVWQWKQKLANPDARAATSQGENAARVK